MGDYITSFITHSYGYSKGSLLLFIIVDFQFLIMSNHSQVFIKIYLKFVIQITHDDKDEQPAVAADWIRIINERCRLGYG
jgi:hypothetical protein